MVDAFNLKRKIPLKFFKDFVNFKFDDNLNLVIPKNSISYLEYLYGKERWKKREKFFKNPLAKKNRPFLGPIDN